MKQLQNLSNANKTYLALAVFAVLIAVFYGNTLFNGFVFDDFLTIEQDEYIHSLRYLPKVVTGCLHGFVDGGCGKTAYPYYRPVHFLSVLLTYQLSPAPWIFHLVNLLYFFAAVSLAFIFVKLLTRKFLIAFLTAFIFAIHPINSAVVNHISAVSELTLAIFVALTLIFSIKYRETGSARHLVLIVLFYFLAILSKEPAVLLPAIILLLDLLFFQIPMSNLLKFKKWKRYLIFLPPLLLYFILKFLVMGTLLGGGTAHFSLAEGVHARIVLFAQYLGKLFYPYPLSIFHPFEKSADFLSLDFFISLGIATSFAVLLFVFLKTRKHILAFSLLWFAMFLSPVLTFLIGEPDHMLFERFVFLSGIGFSLIAAQVFSSALSHSQITKYIALAILILITITSWLIVFPRNTDWKNEEVMYAATLRHYPDAHEIRRNLGELYLEQGEFEKAKTEFEEIIRRDKNWKDITMAYKGLGDYYRVQSDTDKALEYYLKATETGRSARDFVPYNDVGVIYMGEENYLKGFAYFCQSLGLFSGSQAVQDNFNDALSVIDEKYIQKGVLYEKLMAEFEKSSDEKIVYQDKRCDEKSCQYAFSFRAPQLEILPPFLITAATASGQEAEITSKGFNPETGIIFLELDATYKDQTLSFLFPNCARLYYEAIANPQ